MENQDFDDVALKRIIGTIDFYEKSIRSYYIHKHSLNKQKIKDFSEYPFDKYREESLFKEIEAYINSGIRGKGRQELAGRVLWKTREYLHGSFAAHIRDITKDFLYKDLLKDEDKVRFLEYIFSSEKEDAFDSDTLLKLADYNPNENAKINKRLYHKVFRYLVKHPRKKTDLLYKMFDRHVRRMGDMSCVGLKGGSKLYFSLVERLSNDFEQPKGEPLSHMVLKTIHPQGIHGNIVDVFKNYRQYIEDGNTLDENLKRSIVQWCADLDRREIHHFNRKDIEFIGNILKFSIKPKKFSKKSAFLAQMADELKNSAKNYPYRRPFVDVEVNSENAKTPALLRYAQYLFEYAATNPQKKIDADHLEQLVEKNAYIRRLNIVDAGLFGEETQINKKVDQDLVLQLAKKWKSSVLTSEENAFRYNSCFGESMTEMFCRFVTNGHYKPKDVKKLTDVLSADRCKYDAFWEFGKSITEAYAAYRATQAKAIRQARCIAHKKS